MPINSDGIIETMVERDGKLIVNRSQDVTSLFDRNKALAETAPSMFGQAAMRHAGTIDAVTAERWARECGAAIGTKEFALYCKRKLMDSDNSKFLVRGF